MILSLISVSIPGIAQDIQSALLGFIYIDIFQTDRWITFVVPDSGQGTGDATDAIDDYDEPLNTFFDMNSYGSKAVVNNLGSTAIFILGFIVMHLFALGLRFASKKWQR
jgi:hypothetical protein